MSDTFYCRGCGKHKKLELLVTENRCAACHERVKQYMTESNRLKRLRQSRSAAKAYNSPSKLDRKLKYLTGE